MKGPLQIHYDEEADFLEINVGPYTKGYFKDIGQGISERVDEKTGEITGIAILGFLKRVKEMKDQNIILPVKLQISA